MEGFGGMAEAWGWRALQATSGDLASGVVMDPDSGCHGGGLSAITQKPESSVIRFKDTEICSKGLFPGSRKHSFLMNARLLHLECVLLCE